MNATLAAAAPTPIRPYAIAAASMDAHTLATLLHLDPDPDPVLHQTAFATRHVREKETLIRAGDECRNLYVVRSGFFRSSYLDRSGSIQGLGFPMTGDTLGADGLATGRHTAEAVALDCSEVVVIPVARLTALSRSHAALATLFYRLISREIVRDQCSLFLLGSLGAEARVAAFLLDLSDRFCALGYSRTMFNLRMTRQDIGNYLGLKIETVSRILSGLAQQGLISVHHRAVEILDPAGLRLAVEDAARRTAPPGRLTGRRPMGSVSRRPLDILRSEHASIRVVIDTLRRSATTYEQRGADTDAVRPASVLAYLDAFCTRVHGPKEDGPFCLRMLRRAPIAWPVVAGSRLDSFALHRTITSLEQRLIDDPDVQAVAAAIAGFTAQLLRQLARQEAVLFPLALRVLMPDDWQELDALFASSIDPLAGIDRTAGLQTLLTRIDAALPHLHPAEFPEP